MNTVSAIDFADIGAALSKVLSGALDFAITFLEEFDFIGFRDAVASGIGEALGQIDFLELIGKLFVSMIESFFWTFSPANLISGLGSLSSIFGSFFESIGLDSVAGFFKGIGDALNGVVKWMKEHLVDPVVNAVKGLFGIHSPSTVFAEIGGYLIAGLLQGISKAWTGITKFFSGALPNLQKTLLQSWDSVKTTASTKWAKATHSKSGEAVMVSPLLL